MATNQWMNSHSDNSIDHVAFDLGEQAVYQAVRHAENLCTWAKRGIEAAIEPERVAIMAALANLTQEENRLYDLLRRFSTASPYTSRSKILYCWLAIVLSITAGFAFAYLTFTPFGLGPLITSVLSLGASTAVMLSLHKFLEESGSRRSTMILAAVAFTASVAMLFVAAHLRGNVFAYYFKISMTGTAAENGTDDALVFYNGSVHLLQLLFGLLAFAMEICGGLIFNDTFKLPPSRNVEADRMHRRLTEVQEEKVRLAARLVASRNLGTIQEVAIMTAFYRGLYSTARAASRSIGTLSVLVLLVVSSSAQQLVIEAIDSTGSMALPGFKGKSEYQKCVDAFADTVEALPAASRLTIVSITSESFSRPQVLMSRSVPSDRGPLQFINQIKVGKSRMRAELRQVMAQAPANSPQTDLLGFFVYIGGLLREQSQSRKTLMVCSDMRNSASGIDIEHVPTIDVDRTMHVVERKQLVADLSGVDVYVEGVHAAQKSVAYWRSLHTFWTEYFRRTGGRLKSFSMAYEPLRIWGP